MVWPLGPTSPCTQPQSISSCPHSHTQTNTMQLAKCSHCHSRRNTTTATDAVAHHITIVHDAKKLNADQRVHNYMAGKRPQNMNTLTSLWLFCAAKFHVIKMLDCRMTLFARCEMARTSTQKPLLPHIRQIHGITWNIMLEIRTVPVVAAVGTRTMYFAL